VETRNNAEALVHMADKTLAEHGEKIDSSLKAEIEGKIQTLKDTLQGNDIEAIHSVSQDLSQALQQIGQQVYQQAEQDDPTADTDNGGSKPDDSDEDVIEGQFEEA
jgi:molecular chaperone DnaK